MNTVNIIFAACLLFMLVYEVVTFVSLDDYAIYVNHITEVNLDLKNKKIDTAQYNQALIQVTKVKLLYCYFLVMDFMYYFMMFILLFSKVRYVSIIFLVTPKLIAKCHEKCSPKLNNFVLRIDKLASIVLLLVSSYQLWR